jgi:putative tryptophan/tyrosine transport system substrate-binding protein
MRRRKFIAGLGSAAAWPVVARAQQPVPVIGFLGTTSADGEEKTPLLAFLQGLKETGYVVGQNMAVEYRYAVAEGQQATTIGVARGFPWHDHAQKRKVSVVRRAR